MARIYLDRLEPRGYLPLLRESFAWLELDKKVRWGDHVFIKPNLTFPCFRPGVMTSLACLDNLLLALKDYTDRITVVEADSGGYNRFPIDEVFERIGLNQLVQRYGVHAVNLSHYPARSITVRHHGRKLAVPLPVLLLEEADFFITVPVPKVHANAVVSLAVKNQWGCIPDTNERLRLHPFFAPVIHAVNQALRVALAVVDGRYGLTRNGPLRGDIREPGWLLVSDDLYATDLVCCRLMQMEPQTVPHLRYLKKIGALPREESLTFNKDYRAFIGEKFYIEREWADYPGWLAFRSRFLAYLAYNSPLAGFLHRVLYLFREPFY